MNDSIVNYKDYDKSGDHTRQVKKALIFAKMTKASALHFDAGIYNFYDTLANEVECGTKGKNKVIFDLTGFQNFRIDAKNCLFIFHGNSVPFLVSECDNVSITGCVIQRANISLLSAEVADVNLNTRTLCHSSKDKIKFYSSVMLFRNGNENDLCNCVVNFNEGELVSIVDDVTKIRTEKITDTVICDYTKYEQDSEIGDITIFLCKNKSNPAVLILHSLNTLVEDITVSSFDGCGIYGEYSESVAINGVNIVPKKDEYLSVLSDGVELKGLSGVISLTDSNIENTAGCGVKIYKSAAEVVFFENDEIYLKCDGGLVYKKGEFLNICGKDDLKTKETILVKDFERISSDIVKISTDSTDKILKGDIVSMFSENPKIYIGGCSFRNIGENGVETETKDKIIITENYFKTVGNSVKFIGDDEYAVNTDFESEIFVSADIFETCGRDNNSPFIKSHIKCTTDDDTYYFDKINILENKISDEKRVFLDISHVENLDVLGNEGKSELIIKSESIGNMRKD